MIITILSCIIFGIGIACPIICTKCRPKNEDTVFGIGVICLIVGLIAVLFSMCFLCSNIITYDTNYQNTLYEKQVLEYRLENEDNNIVGNELLYNDIVEFNNYLREVKKFANNPWTNWFYNADIASIDYIEIDGMNN